MRNKKNILMISMIIAVLLLVIGFAAFNTNLTINGTGSISSTWKIEITKITSSATGLAYNLSEPTYGGTNATINTGLRKPGDKMEYTVTVKNGGTLGAIINTVDAEVNGHMLIIYSIEGIEGQTRLGAGESIDFKIIVEFDSSATYIPSEASKEITININTIQDDGQVLTPTIPEIEGELNNNTLFRRILSDNTYLSDSTIDFSKMSYYPKYEQVYGKTSKTISFYSSSNYYFGTDYTFNELTGMYTLTGSTTYTKWSESIYRTYPYACKTSTNTCSTLYVMVGYSNSSSGVGYEYTRTSSYKENGKGLYYTSANTENGQVTYYFRGAVENNYVQFGTYVEDDIYESEYNGTVTLAKAGDPIIWRIVRINEDGSIRLTTQKIIDQSQFNYITGQAYNGFTDNAYLGYMYGTAGSTSYSGTHANTNDSTIKKAIDEWYVSNLSNYSSYLADAGFCNDRSVYSGSGTGGNLTKYGAYNRLYNNDKPQFKCPLTSDLFTTSTSTKGNKALDYPIGLLTLDEVIYAGGLVTKNGITSYNSNYYLNNDQYWWTMTPIEVVTTTDARIGIGTSDGRVNFSVVDWEYNYNSGYRPVINLKPTVEVESGTGTADSPYVIKIS